MILKLCRWNCPAWCFWHELKPQMGVELPALRVLCAIAYSAISILAWEVLKSLVSTHPYDCAGEGSCTYRRAAQLQAQIGALTTSHDVRFTIFS